MRNILILSAIILFASCKSKAVLTEVKAKDKLPAETIAANHYKNVKDFKTLYVKASARYEDEDNTQNVNAEIKIKKDEQILISIRVLGITMAKALITPTEVKYYEKIGGKFFEGDYTSLSRWLGTDLDFQKVQNLLIGQAMDDLTKGNYKVSIENNRYKLENSDPSTMKAFYFEAGKFFVMHQHIEQPKQNRVLDVRYPKFANYPQADLPSGINIDASQPKGKIKINIDYNSATFNEEMSFPYSVPEGYERITIE